MTSSPMNLVKVRGARALQVARCGGRRGLRRELLAVDYVLPLRRRRADVRHLELRTKGPAAAGNLYFGRESFPVDRVAYLGIFLEGWYDAEYRDAVVVDIGGHKGYFGAFALHAGAGEVRSYEPEATNFATLHARPGASTAPGTSIVPRSARKPGRRAARQRRVGGAFDRPRATRWSRGRPSGLRPCPWSRWPRCSLTPAAPAAA